MSNAILTEGLIDVTIMLNELSLDDKVKFLKLLLERVSDEENVFSLKWEMPNHCFLCGNKLPLSGRCLNEYPEIERQLWGYSFVVTRGALYQCSIISSDNLVIHQFEQENISHDTVYEVVKTACEFIMVQENVIKGDNSTLEEFNLEELLEK